MRTAFLVLMLLFSSACSGGEAASFQRPACGSNDWRAMQEALTVQCRSHIEGPVAADTCQRLAAGFARCEVDLRPATSIHTEWAYGLAAVADLGGGGWTAAVFHSYEGSWLVAGFDGYDPQAVAPACNSPEWQQMQQAADDACRLESGVELQREICASLRDDFTHCNVRFSDNVSARSAWGAGLWAAAHLDGPYWGGAMFQRSSGRWIVVAFRDGESR